MPASYGNTAKYALRKLLGSNVVSDIDAGFAALADDLDGLIVSYSQGTLASRPTSTGGSPGKQGRLYRATDVGILFYDNGTGWDPVSTPPIVTALPSGATLFDGQEVFLQTAAMAALGVRWHLAYRAGASGSYKWEFLGGPPLLAQANPAGGVASGVANLSLALPVAGDYIVDSGIRAQHNVWPFAARLNVYKPGGSVLVSADTAWFAQTGGSGYTRVTAIEKALATALPSGTYIGDTENLAGDPSIFSVWMQFTPIRVG